MKLLTITFCCLTSLCIRLHAYAYTSDKIQDRIIQINHKLTFDSVKIEPKINKTLLELTKLHIITNPNGELFAGILYDYYEIGEGPRYKTYINNVESEFLSYLEMQHLAKESKLTKETLVWQGGMKSWEKAGGMEELSDLFDNYSKKAEFLGYFSNGKIDSLFSYFANGKLHTKIIYYELFSEYVNYYSNGQVRLKGKVYYNHQQGMYEGGYYVGEGHMCEEFEFYNKNGKPYQTGKYIDKKTGSFLYSEFLDNGELKMTKEYTGARKKSIHSVHGYSWDYHEKYYLNGLPSKSYSYINGKHSEQLITNIEEYSTSEKSKINESKNPQVSNPTPIENKPPEVSKSAINYKSITIGSQVWMGQNLNVDKFRNGDPIPEAKTESEWYAMLRERRPAWCYYNNDPANATKYGKLYNVYAVNDPRGLAPQGWHIPSYNEWKALKDFLDDDGRKLKSNSGWHSYTQQFMNECHNCSSWNPEYRRKVPCHVCKDTRRIPAPKETYSGNGSNTSGFGGQPGGCYSPKRGFMMLGQKGIWWSSTEYSSFSQWVMTLSQGYKGISLDKEVGLGFTSSDLNIQFSAFSVRCIKD